MFIINNHNIMNIDDFNNVSIYEVMEIVGIDREEKKEDNKCVDRIDCVDCGNKNYRIIDNVKGMVICSKCGEVVDEVIDDSTEKSCGDSDTIARCAMIHNTLLPQSSLGTPMNASGILLRLHIWFSMPYKERSNNKLFKKIDGICNQNNIPWVANFDAKLLCKKVNCKEHTMGENINKPIITRGKHRTSIVAGCIQIACRKNGHTRSAKEIADYFAKYKFDDYDIDDNYDCSDNDGDICKEIDEGDVNKGVTFIYTILKDDNILKDIGSGHINDFIKRKCDEMHIRNVYTEKAIIIGNNVEKLGIASNHTTYALAAASVLLMAQMNNVERINKEILSEYFSGLTCTTIERTYYQIKPHYDILIDNKKTNNVCEKVDEKRKVRTISKEIEQKMIQFGVDTTKYIVVDANEKVENAENVKKSENNEEKNKNIIKNFDTEKLTRDDIVDNFNILKKQIVNLLKIKNEINEKEYTEYKKIINKYRKMLTEYFKENPYDLVDLNIDQAFFYKHICSTQKNKQMIKNILIKNNHMIT